MPEHLFGEGEPQRHQEDGPVDGVETDDVFADDVHVGGPVFIEEGAAVPVRVVTEAGDVVGQRVQPDVDDVAGVEIDGDAPSEGGAGDAQILQPGL